MNSWSDEQTILFIEMYRNHRVLWDQTEPLYKNKNVRHNELMEIADYFTIDKSEVEKKIRNLQSQFARERRKEQESRKSGVEEAYTSKWFAYKSLMFLADKNKPRNTQDSEDVTDDIDPSSIVLANCSVPEENSSTFNPSKKKLKLEIHEDEFNSIPCNKICKCQNVRVSDEYDTLTITWANDLRKMEAKQAIFARKAINDILMEGLLGNLEHNSTHYQGYLVPKVDHSFIAPNHSQSEFHSESLQE